MDIAAALSGVDHLAEEKRASISQLRCEPAKLVPGIRLGQGFRPLGYCIAGENRRACFRIERGRIKAKLLGQCMVELQQFRGNRRGCLAAHEKAFKGAGEAVIEVEVRMHYVNGKPELLFPMDTFP